MSFEPETLYRALKRLPPRTEQLLWARFVDGRTDEDCARRYSIPPDAWAVQVLRAAKQLADAVKAPEAGPLIARAERIPADVEAHQAQSLMRALAARVDDAATMRAHEPEGEAAAAGALGGAAPRPLNESAGANFPNGGATPGALAWVVPLRHLTASSTAIRAVAEARARAELESPQYQRREQLRRVALLALIGAAIWLWYRSPPHR